MENAPQFDSMKRQPCEYKMVALRECPMPEEMQLCDVPDKAVAYWHAHVPSAPYFNPDVECLIVILLNARRRVRGHYLVSMGTLDSLMAHAREVFRVAILGAAHAILLLHNHPSGDPTPSEADIKVTRDFVRAGQLLKIELLDHIIVGKGSYRSLREAGYLF